MNILFLSHLYPKPNDSSHGIFVHRQVKQIQKQGHRVVVLSPVPWSPRILHFKEKWRNYGATPTNIKWEGVEVYYPRYLRLPGAWFRSLSSFTFYNSISTLAARLNETYKFDVIHSNTLLPDGLAGLYLGKKLNLATVCTVRGSDALIYPYENPLNLFFSKMVVRRTEQLVAVSYALKTEINKLAEPSREIQVAYNGVDIEKFQNTLVSNKNSKQKQLIDKPYILFIGRQIHIKGLKDLLVAFSQVVDELDYNLVVIGPQMDQVRNLAPELIQLLNGRLILTGPLAPDEIPSYMQNCTLFVLPSYSEGLPNVVLEAMACGKPVIATEIMGIPEAVVDQVTGVLIQPGMPKNLARTIRLLIANPERCREMGKLGRKRVEKNFTWEGNASALLSIYQKIISQTVCL